MWCATVRQRWRRSAVSRFLLERWGRTARHQVVGLASGAAVWLEATPSGSLAWQQVTWNEAPTGSDAAAAIASLTNRLQGSSCRQATWILALGLAPGWLQQPSPQIRSLDELHAVSRARASQLFGAPVSPLATEMTWNVMADWHARRPFVCAAVPAGWQQLLQMHGNGSTLSIRSAVTQPLLLALSRLQKQLPKDGWLALVLAGELHLMHRRAGHLTRLRSLRLPTDGSTARIQSIALEEWQREVLRSQLRGDVLHWLDLMPLDSSPADTALLRTIKWTADPRIPVPPDVAHPETQTPHSAWREAMQTAWTAEQLLSSEIR